MPCEGRRDAAIVSPAAKYFEDSVEGKCGAQLARMKAARLFNPLHILSSGEADKADVEALSLFRMSEHKLIAPNESLSR